MQFDGYVACICEGTAEEVIINRLLDADVLTFNREQMLEEGPLRVRSADNFEKST